MKKWFENTNEGYFIFDEDGNKVKVESKHEFPQDSKWLNEERNRAIAFRKMIEDSDPTAFGAAMSCGISDAVTFHNGELKAVVFVTVNAALRGICRWHDRNFKRKCLRRVEEFYSKKEYQLKVQLDDWEYNDHILRPIIFIVSEEGVIDAVPTHRELSKMEIVPVADCYYALDIDETGRIDVKWVLEQFRNEREIHDEDFDRWGTMSDSTYAIKE